MTWPNHPHVINFVFCDNGYIFGLNITDTIQEGRSLFDGDPLISIRSTQLEFSARFNNAMLQLRVQGYNPSQYLKDVVQLFTDGQTLLENLYNQYPNIRDYKSLADNGEGFILAPYRQHIAINDPMPRPFQIPLTSLQQYAALGEKNYSVNHDIEQLRNCLLQDGVDFEQATSSEGLVLNPRYRQRYWNEIDHSSLERKQY